MLGGTRVAKQMTWRGAAERLLPSNSSMLRLHTLDLFMRVFIVTNIIGLLFVWSYSQRQEATRVKYEELITNELAVIQARISVLQQEAEKSHSIINEMQEAVNGFIARDSKSHQRLHDILREAQQELLGPSNHPAAAIAALDRAVQQEQVLSQNTPPQIGPQPDDTGSFVSNGVKYEHRFIPDADFANVGGQDDYDDDDDDDDEVQAGFVEQQGVERSQQLGR